MTGTLKIVAMIQGMNMKRIKAMTIMHEIKEINILYTQSVQADCLNHLFSTYTKLNYQCHYLLV